MYTSLNSVYRKFYKYIYIYIYIKSTAITNKLNVVHELVTSRQKQLFR